MRLATFFRKVAPVLEGRVSVADGTKRLYAKRTLDAKRLAIYARFCRTHREQALSVFAYTRDVIAQRKGEEAWNDLVERTFRVHPMHHFEMNENGAPFPTFLPAQLKRLRLPLFWAELADFEWWEWKTRSALDQPGDAHDRGRLRLGETVELRPYSRRWVEWISEAKRQGEPDPGAEVVIFWRDRKLRPRREVATPEELQLLKALYEGATSGAALKKKGLAGAGLDDLRDAGIVRGGQAV